MSHGKAYRNSLEQIDRNRDYPLDQAISLLKEVSTAKFDESIELAVNLGVDPRHADQLVRGTVNLPHGTGKTVRVLVFAKGEKLIEAQAAGADYCGAEDLVEKIKGGWFDFDAVVSTPDMMRDVGKLGAILGPRKLMPTPKTGTVTNDLAKTVQELKAGKIEFRVDKNGVIHAAIGKISFSKADIEDNLTTLMDAIMRARPTTVKGPYLEKMTVASTMGPGIKIDKTIFA